MKPSMLGTAETLELDDAGALIGSEDDARDIIAACYGTETAFVIAPARRLHPDFFRLRSGMAGAFIQKLQNYELRLVVVGDISVEVAQSTALRDFVVETNRVGRHRFLPDRAALSAALS